MQLPPVFSDELLAALRSAERLNAQELAADERFWNWLRAEYDLDPDIINLNYGGISPQARCVQAAENALRALINRAPSWYNWFVLEEAREHIRGQLAALVGCPATELALVRNTTEAMGLLTWGLPLQAGDEVVLAEQTYVNVKLAWQERARRDGLVLKWVAHPTGPVEPEELVDAYARMVGPRTKVLVLMHMVNYTGQLLPVKTLATWARRQGIWVAVDGAQSFLQYLQPVSDLNSCVWGTSLHKWLGSPFGTGAMVVRQDRIEALPALFPRQERAANDVRKFEGAGTRAFAPDLAMGHALALHNALGSQRLAQRLRHLNLHWLRQAQSLRGFRLLTPESQCVALATFSLEPYAPQEVVDHLMARHRIHVVPIHWGGAVGVRVSPQVFTPPSHLDALLEGLAELAAQA